MYFIKIETWEKSTMGWPGNILTDKTNIVAEKKVSFQDFLLTTRKNTKQIHDAEAGAYQTRIVAYPLLRARIEETPWVDVTAMRTRMRCANDDSKKLFK